MKHDHLCARIRKLFATLVSALVPQKELRHKVRDLLHPYNAQRTIAYFQKEYVCKLQFPDMYAETEQEGPFFSPYIWQCWLQGTEQAPDVVRRCLRSVEVYKEAGQQVILLTEDNISDYLELPPYILEKRRKGIIPDAQFSDILRVYLLDKYGGLWIDATCLLTSSIPEWVYRQPFFVFQSAGEFAYTQIQSCFLYSSRSSWLLKAWKEILDSYWKNEDSMMHYFQLHLMFVALVTGNKYAKKCYAAMKKVSEAPTKELYELLSHPTCDAEKLKEISDRSFVHKLTYKTPLFFPESF